jgi:hypothetical protein
MTINRSLIAVAASLSLSLGLHAHAAGTVTSAIGIIGSSLIVPEIVVGVPPDSVAAHVDPNVSTSPFSGVVSVNIIDAAGSFLCSGTLVSSTQVVSAGHCVDTNGQGSVINLSTPGNSVSVIFNSNGNQNAVIAASAVAMDPQYRGFGICPPGNAAGIQCLNHDFSVITLSAAAPATAQTYSVLGTPMSGQMPITMIGYGTTGNGVNGLTSGSSSFTVKHSGQNYAEFYQTDDFQHFTGGANGVWYADFDGSALNQNLFCNSTHAADWGFSCAPSLANNLESAIGPGDSGGAAFILLNGQYVLAGNTTFTGTYTGQTAGTFGTYFGGATTGADIAFLTAATNGAIQVVSVPEAKTYAMMLLGLAGIAGTVRRRRADEQA